MKSKVLTSLFFLGLVLVGFYFYYNYIQNGQFDISNVVAKYNNGRSLSNELMNDTGVKLPTDITYEWSENTGLTVYFGRMNFNISKDVLQSKDMQDALSRLDLKVVFNKKGYPTLYYKGELVFNKK